MTPPRWLDYNGRAWYFGKRETGSEHHDKRSKLREKESLAKRQARVMRQSYGILGEWRNWDGSKIDI